MRLAVILAFGIAAGTIPAVAQPAPTAGQRAARWSAHVEALASDAMEGREAGTPGHQRAADYVVAELRRLGLRPAGSDGFFQQVPLIERGLNLAGSSASLTVAGATTGVDLPSFAVAFARTVPPAAVDAPLVFIGYGLHAPGGGHDDFAGVDLRGKIAVYINGTVPSLSGAHLSHARAQRGRLLAERGAVGSISLIAPGQLQAPWARLAQGAGTPDTVLGGSEAGSAERPFLEMVWNPAEAQRLFAGASRSFAEVAADAEASRPIRGFGLAPRLSGRFATTTSESKTSPNVLALLPGSDPQLAGEYIVMSAHLDGLGVGEAVNGDRINNGALDNASGVAALLDMAEQLRGRNPRRSILFAFVTAEEAGLLGSSWFVRNPTVPREAIVANLNYDMALPLFPLRSVLVLGAEQSSIGETARAVGAQLALPVSPDPFPDRNSFIRSDQYSFIREGIPSVAFKFGFAVETPEATLELAFRADRYHNRTDDLTTPIRREDEIRLHDFIATLALRLANADERPRWNEGSVFARPGR